MCRPAAHHPVANGVVPCWQAHPCCRVTSPCQTAAPRFPILTHCILLPRHAVQRKRCKDIAGRDLADIRRHTFKAKGLEHLGRGGAVFRRETYLGPVPIGDQHPCAHLEWAQSQAVAVPRRIAPRQASGLGVALKQGQAPVVFIFSPLRIPLSPEKASGVSTNNRATSTSGSRARRRWM